MRVLSLYIPMAARGKQRPRVTRAGHVYTPKETVAAEKQIATLAKEAMQGKEIMKGGVHMCLDIQVSVPKSFTKKRRELALSGEIFPTTKPDLDNVVKLIADAMNGIVYLDDKQIVDLRVIKRYCDVDSMWVHVSDKGG